MEVSAFFSFIRVWASMMKTVLSSYNNYGMFFPVLLVATRSSRALIRSAGGGA